MEADELKLLLQVSSAKKDPIGFYLYNNCITVMEKNYQGPNPRGGFLGDLVSCDDLYDHYCKWCNAKSLTQIGKDEFARELEAMGFTKNKLEALSRKIGEENIYAYIKKWIGLALVSLDEYHPVNWFPK